MLRVPALDGNASYLKDPQLVFNVGSRGQCNFPGRNIFIQPTVKIIKVQILKFKIQIIFNSARDRFIECKILR